MASRPNHVLAGALLYFANVFAVGFVLGAVRVPFVVPMIGERYAELAEMPLMFIAIYLAAGHVVGKFRTTVRSSALLVLGFLSLVLLLIAELLLAVALAGRGLAEYISSRDPVSGTVYLLMLLVFAAMPWFRRESASARH